jgi:DNA-binding NarL/FixJ family response regulator
LVQIEVVGFEMSPRKALAQISRQQVDVVLLDLVMPEMDGLEFLKRAKSQPGSPLVGISTLFDDPGYCQVAEAVQADGFISK